MAVAAGVAVPSTVWGITLLLEAVAKALVVQSASTLTALAVNNTAPWLVFGLLIAWTWWYGVHLTRKVEPEDDTAPNRSR